jgi:hypothetical protein
MSKMTLRTLWNLFRAKDENAKVVPPNVNHQLTDEDRRHSAEMRRLRQENEQMEKRFELLRKQKLIERQESLLYDDEEEEEDGEDEDEDSQILGMVTQLFNTATGAQKSPAVSEFAPQPSPQTFQTGLSDADIRDFIVKQDRKYIKVAKTMPKELLKRQAMQQMGITEQEAERAHQILITEF